MTTGIIMILIFLVMALLMYLEKISTILVLPLMAFLFAVVAITANLISTGIPHADPNLTYGFLANLKIIFKQYWDTISIIFSEGSVKLSKLIITTIFGGMLAIYIKNLKIAEKMIYWTAEFAGDKPLIICFSLFVLTAVLFSSVGGLGAVIMIGTIILPILGSVGVPPIAGAGIFLMGICAGGSINPGNMTLYIETFHIPQEEVKKFAAFALAIYVVCGIIWLLFTVRKSTVSNFWAEKLKNPEIKLSPLSFVSPIVPVALVFIFNVEPISAFIISLVFTFIVSIKHTTVRLFCKSLIEGAQSVMPASILMLGIGILIQSVMNENVNMHLKPILNAIIPGHWLIYIIGFGIVAPLALYRGPLNTWGLGFGLGALMMATNILPPKAIMGMLISVGMIQGVCDPTNTQNVWIASYQGITTNYILRKTLPFVWVSAVVLLVISSMLYLR